MGLNALISFYCQSGRFQQSPFLLNDRYQWTSSSIQAMALLNKPLEMKSMILILRNHLIVFLKYVAELIKYPQIDVF